MYAINEENLDANALLDAVRQKTGLKTDAALSKFLEVAGSTVSKVRSRQNKVSASLVLSIHENAGMSIHQIKQTLGYPVDQLFRFRDRTLG